MDQQSPVYGICFSLGGQAKHGLLLMGMHQKWRDGDPALRLDHKAQQLSGGWREDYSGRWLLQC